uniref:Putative ovule protein n=1 Tax=Solanum chacoense TaxID=4108 RepID=A0A0V0HNI7_SOLCH
MIKARMSEVAILIGQPLEKIKRGMSMRSGLKIKKVVMRGGLKFLRVKLNPPHPAPSHCHP